MSDDRTPVIETEPRTRWRSPTIAMVAGLAAFALGAVLLAQPWSAGSAAGALILGTLLSVLWRAAGWVGATALLVALAPPRLVRRLSIAAAPVSAIIASVIESWSVLTFTGPAVVTLLAIPIALNAAAMLVCAVLGWAISDRFSTAAPHRARLLVGCAAVALVLGGAATIALFTQWFSVYFRIWADAAPAVEPFGPQGVRYLVTAGCAIVLTTASAVFATVARARGLRITAWILVPAVLVIAVVLQVPQGRFAPAPEPEPDLSHYTECAFDANRPGCGG